MSRAPGQKTVSPAPGASVGQGALFLRRTQVGLGFLVVLGGLVEIVAADGVHRVNPPLALPPALTRTVDFARDVRPLFEARCLSCHGPEKQRADFRLDRRAAALKGGESGPAIVPNRSEASLLIQLVAGLDDDRPMPPRGDRLTEEQVGMLRGWIDQGAAWPVDPSEASDDPLSHWSFQPVRRPAVPTVGSGSAGARGSSPVDAFIRTRLAADGLDLSPEAPRATLLRRLYLVMLGLAPSPAEVAEFEADPASDAFERRVERMLQDPRYGERWGRHWLDVVRFAESNGFETNRERPNAWRFRDYVIEAFNRDLPYDRFIREQLAGDVLGADVATGFLVAGPVDIVASPDPVLTAQQRADELDDMVNTTGTAFLGLTLGCARCHNHKFDPIEQREYYSISAIFAGVRHGERPLPMSSTSTQELARIEASIRALTARLERFVPGAASGSEARPAVLRGPVNPRENVEILPVPIEARFLRFTVLATTGGEPCLDELEVYSGDRNVALAEAGGQATASGTLPGFAIHQLEHVHDGRTGNNWSWISDQAGSGWVQLEWPAPERIDRIVWGRDREGQFKDRLAVQYRIEAALNPGEWRLVASSDDRELSPADSAKSPPLVYRFEGHPEAIAAEGRQWVAELEALRQEREALARPSMIYAGNFVAPVATRRLHRGDPMQPREDVPPATLAVFRPLTLSAEEPEAQRRLKLAEWITHSDNPLTARVLVNRLWQYHFGVGLVDTPSDFGRSGTRPTHPELLDWLASEFVAQGWSVKALHRRILLSATWRQSGAPRPEAARVDAASRLLWRFPPRRLEAEAIRDGILQVSGSLKLSSGGPGFHLLEVERENVYHYHPKETFTDAEHRRMIYAYKVRMEQDDIFGAFDCPDGSLAVPRRSLSTTPLQALNLFNSGFVLRQSEALAERLRREAGQDLAAQIRRAWQLAFNREPAPEEAADATEFATRHGLAAMGRALLNANEFLFIP
ncbi:MAG: DUF1553 domain-containing protein [Limisphaerales bacterium]